MHLGLITTGYPHRGDPVSGAFVREMARALAERGHRIEVLCAARPDDEPIADAGIRVRPVRYLPRGISHGTFHDEGAPERLRRGDPIAWLGAVSFPLIALRDAREQLAACDALISHFVLPSAVIAALVRRDRPHLAVAHGTDARLFARLPAALQRRVLNGCTAMRVTHGALRNALAPAVRDDPRVSVAPMGWRVTAPDGHASARARAELLHADERILVLTVARAVAVKGLDVLVEAARRLPPHVRVVIAGDGPERASLAHRAPPNVTWLGAVDSARRDTLLHAADVSALPSRAHEGAPVALLEAMGAGLAVIASQTPGIAEIAGDAGLLVPPDNALELAHAITRLANDNSTRASLGEKARLRVPPWHWTAQAAAIEALLSR